LAEKFEEVIGASETHEAKILTAQAHAVSTNNWAAGESFKRVTTAQADYYGIVTNSAARALLFADQEMAYSAAPGFNGVYEQQARLAALVENSGDARKYIMATTNKLIIPIYNLEDKIRPDLLENLSAPTNK
jgi:hypothetical protein